MKLFKSLPFYKRSNYSTACNNLSLTTHLQKRSFIQKGKEKIFIPKASFTIISTLMDVPHKTVSRSALVFYLEQAYHHEILDNTLTVHIASIRRLLGDEYIKTHKTVGYFWDFDVFKVG